MIVHRLADGRLWCINQTAHAAQAHEFCRHWGNEAVAAPLAVAATAVRLAIANHDGGWADSEAAPAIGPDGRPVDFQGGPRWDERLAQWRAGVQRASAQHPYAGVLVGRHAVELYRRFGGGAGPEEAAATEEFAARVEVLLGSVRAAFGPVPGWAPALEDGAILFHTKLLQYGDAASLRLCVPWAPVGRLQGPAGMDGSVVDLEVRVGEGEVCVDPWPYGTGSFEVSVWGRVLDDVRFADDDAYRAALSTAPVLERRWRVAPGR
jgi:hypothetical protein